MTRRIDRRNLEGIIEDFACGLHPYFLNREPNEWKYLRFLAEGAHWNGQRKLKKADRSGHLGVIWDVPLLQHLREKNYFNFMRYMKIFLRSEI